jgi:hypothetical protein
VRPFFAAFIFFAHLKLLGQIEKCCNLALANLVEVYNGQIGTKHGSLRAVSLTTVHVFFLI